MARIFADDFVLIRMDEGNGSQSSIPQVSLVELGNSIQGDRPHFVSDVIATESEMCLVMRGRIQVDFLIQLLQQHQEKISAVRDKGTENFVKIWRLPVRFTESEDWEEMQRYSGIGRQQIKSALLESELRMAMFGFQPGFLYLRGHPQNLWVPRRSVPRKRVAANSLAIGGEYVGLYSLESPGGWQILGESAVTVFEQARIPPVVIAPGDRVQLVELDDREFESVRDQHMTLTQFNRISIQPESR